MNLAKPARACNAQAELVQIQIGWAARPRLECLRGQASNCRDISHLLGKLNPKQKNPLSQYKSG